MHDPEILFQKFDFASRVLVCRRMTRAEFSRSTFLDERVESQGEQILLRLDRFLGSPLQMTDVDRKAGYIFHTAYCCSTLLSRAVDCVDKCLVLREPPTLHQLAVLQRRREEAPPKLLSRWGDLLDLALLGLNKRFTSNEVTVIKATDSCNNIIEQLLFHKTGGNALLLYSQLEDFVISNLKSDGRRKFLGNLLARAQRDLCRFPDLEVPTVALDDARAAALVWMVQISSYRLALDVCGARCKTLDAVSLLEFPHESLSAVSSHLGLPFTASDFNNVIKGPVWHNHSKDRKQEGYDRDRRLREKAALRDSLAEEVNAAISWVRGFPGWSETADLQQDLLK